LTRIASIRAGDTISILTADAAGFDALAGPGRVRVDERFHVRFGAGQ